jgi:hypothetical protein
MIARIDRRNFPKIIADMAKQMEADHAEMGRA